MMTPHALRSIAGLLVAACALLVLDSSTAALRPPHDALASWNDTPTKLAILEFVESVVDPGSAHFVKPEDRVAVFDNDGTLWCEKPLYIHFSAVFDHMREQISGDPSLKEREPYRSVATKDKAYFMDLYENMAFETLVGSLLGVPYGGMTTDAYAELNRRWLASWTHPKLGVGYRQLIYQPMVELVDLLHDNDFTVYILTADESAFLRLVSEELYGIPPERVHGTHVRTEYVVEGDETHLVRTYRVDSIDNWDAKPRLIDRVIGKRPILAGGNSNGDQHMLQYVSQQDGPSLALLVHHTDGDREYAYDSHTDKVMPLAKQEGWTVVDMKDDWGTVFPSAED